ncbi:hypothetical protein VTL71DRAFT_10960 [Oculimacula yallundae]|uniref:Uncharacterized protein n=1 Tax=Oculimacula yallundae TaxID=86028 RepID=A0ABR4CUR6_9HELO
MEATRQDNQSPRHEPNTTFHQTLYTSNTHPRLPIPFDTLKRISVPRSKCPTITSLLIANLNRKGPRKLPLRTRRSPGVPTSV